MVMDLGRPIAAMAVSGSSNCNRSEAFFQHASKATGWRNVVIIVAIGVLLAASTPASSTVARALALGLVVINLTPHRLVLVALTLVVCIAAVPSPVYATETISGGGVSNLSWTPLRSDYQALFLRKARRFSTASPSPSPAPTSVPRSANHDPMWVHRLIFAGLNGLLFLLGLANVLVLFIVSRYRRMRTVTNILIFNLCLADLIYISFLPVVIMFQLLRDWMFGIVACKLFYITESTAKYASVYFVGVLSLDRYFALCHPQVCKRYRRPSLALLVSAIGWFVTAILMTPIYLYSTVIGVEGERFCTVAWPQERTPLNASFDHETILFPDTYPDSERVNLTYAMVSNQTEEYCTDHSNETCMAPGAMPGHAPPKAQFYFITLTFVFCFGIPALVILFFYVKVLDQLFQASDRAERLKKRREKTYRKVTRMVLAVISFYLICWLPYWIQFLVVTFATFALNNALKIFFNTIHLLPYLNCAMNPILYSLMTDNFRRILGELFPMSSVLALFCRRGAGKQGKSTKSQSAQAIALVDKATRNADEHAYDEKGGLLHTNGETGFMSLSASISPSIRMVSDFSINLLVMKGSASRDDVVGSPSAASINSM